MPQITTEQIRAKGLKALAQELGPSGLIRFLQLFETGHGNYSKERHELFEGQPVERLLQKTKRKKKLSRR